MDKKDKIQICKVVAQAVLADGQITDAEHAFLDKLIQRYQLDPDERKEVLNRNYGDDPGAMVAGVESTEAKTEVLVELALVAAVDGQVASSERSLLKKVAKVLDVPETELDLMINAALS